MPMTAKSRTMITRPQPPVVFRKPKYTKMTAPMKANSTSRN